MTSFQKKIAAKILKVGETKVWLDPTKVKDIEAAITKADIRRMIQKGAIKVLKESTSPQDLRMLQMHLDHSNLDTTATYLQFSQADQQKMLERTFKKSAQKPDHEPEKKSTSPDPKEDPAESDNDL